MNRYHIRPLPYWVLTDLQPAFYESESGTVLQQLSRIYPKIQEVINAYNDFVRDVNRYIDEFETGIINDFECFKNCIIKTMNDYIESIDTKINLQDMNIQNAINYMKDNIVATTTNVINQAIANGDLNVGFEYNPSDEALDFIVTREGD